MKGRMTTMKKNMKILVAVAPIVLLSACAPVDWIKNKFANKKHDTTVPMVDEALVQQGQVLVSMNGKSIISDKSLDYDFEQLIEENPQLKQVLPLMPEAKYNFLQGMISQAVVDKSVQDSKIDQKPEYQQELARMMRSVKRMLNTKYFGMAHSVEVADAEVEKFYEDNKNTMPDLLVSRGGIKAVGVPFAKEEEAKAFAAKVKNNDVAKAAKSAGLHDKVRDFKLVNHQSVGMDNAVKNKIVALNKFPSVEIVKGDDKTVWVVNATEKQGTQYRPFEQVKSGIKQFVEKEKRMAIFDTEINKLKQQYNVVVNDSYFKAKEGVQVAEQELEVKEAPKAA